MCVLYRGNNLPLDLISTSLCPKNFKLMLCNKPFMYFNMNFSRLTVPIVFKAFSYDSLAVRFGCAILTFINHNDHQAHKPCIKGYFFTFFCILCTPSCVHTPNLIILGQTSFLGTNLKPLKQQSINKDSIFLSNFLISFLLVFFPLNPVP